MLLVAMLALGSATFAWFTANPVATASGLSLKTTASAGLEVRTDTDTNWSHEALLNKDGGTFNLTPASQKQADGEADKFYTVAAEAADAYAAKSGEDMSSATTGYTGGKNVYAEKVYFRLSPGSDTTANAGKKVQLTSVDITPVTGAELAGSVKVAVVDSTKKIIGTYTTDVSSQNNHGTLVATADDDLTPKAEAFSPTITEAGDITDIDVNATALKNTADLSKYVTVYVYLDGQHEKCASENVTTVDAAEMISDISLSFLLV
ncbi:MAG: hypothetical protein ACI4RM_05415, partial [Ruminococcus sp.]